MYRSICSWMGAVGPCIVESLLLLYGSICCGRGAVGPYVVESLLLLYRSIFRVIGAMVQMYKSPCYSFMGPYHVGVEQ